jgi:hypothetical protein
MKSSSIAVFLFLVGCVGAAQLKVIDDTTYESGAARSPVYGYEITYKSTHQIDDIYFVKNGARTIPFMESFPTYGGCTLTQGGPCNGGHQSPWDSSGKADNSGCWSFTTHSILCDHDITSDEVHIEFWSGGYSSTSGFTVKSLDAGGSVIATVADVGSRSGLTACNALDGAGTPTICPVSPPTTYTQPTAATPSPTAATPSPTSAPSPAASGASAVGDPHLQNVHGERFDLMKEGNHVLISIPRGQIAENALLRVRADARRLGGQCADMYFQALNVTGSWAEASQAGGYHYSVEQTDAEIPEWVALGKVELKVVRGCTDSGLRYLNLYVKHLGRAGFVVGGLLGEDDHEDVMVPPEACATRLALVDNVEAGLKAPSVASVAVATLA